MKLCVYACSQQHATVKGRCLLSLQVNIILNINYFLVEQVQLKNLVSENFNVL
jgi:hypothetical protein